MALGLAEISDEIVLLILEQASEIASRSLLNLCRVSKRFCRLSSALIYRSITIPSSKLRDHEAADLAAGSYTFQANVLAYSRHLTVGSVLNWDVLSNVLSNMSRLESIRWLYWERPFPSIIKERLHRSWPDTELLIEGLTAGCRTDGEEMREIGLDLLKSLVSCRNIHSFKLEIQFEHPVTMRLLKDVLLSSPKLKILHFTLPRGRDGEVQWLAHGVGFSDLCIQPEERLSPLTELVYEGRMPLEERSVIPASFFDFTQIRHLVLRGPILDMFLVTLGDQSLNVKILTVRYFSSLLGGRHEALEKFISRTRGVESLQIIGIAGRSLLPVSTVFVLGDTIKDLELRYARNDTTWLGGTLQDSCSPYDLNELRTFCPQISSLALEMQIFDTLPYDFLAGLARFPQLSTVRIYFQFKEIFGSQRGDVQQPHILTDRLTALHMFSYIRDHKVGVTLDRLEVVMSDRARRSRRVSQLSYHDRPNILFTCREGRQGNVVVEYDPPERQDVSWSSYFEPEILKTSPGKTYPDNLLEIIEAGEEANRIMSEVGNVTADVDDLFEGPEILTA